MSEYKGITHTLVDILQERRKAIHSVPRPEDGPREKNKNIARPDDAAPNKDGQNYTKEVEQLAKVDEQSVPPQDPNQAKRRPKKLEIEDIGKQPPTKVEINPELDNTPNLFASTEVKGKEISEADYKHPAVDPKAKRAFDTANKLKRFQKTHDFTGGEDTPDPRARREAEQIAAYARSLQGKTIGGFKITGKLTDKDIEQGARIRARINKLNKGDLSEDKYNNVAIQYQTVNGIWVTARKTSDNPSDILLALQNVQKAYRNNRVRAIGARGQVVDMWPIDPADLQREAVVYHKGTPKIHEPGINAASREDLDKEAKLKWLRGHRSKEFRAAERAHFKGTPPYLKIREETGPKRRLASYLSYLEKKHPGFTGSPGHKKLQAAAQKHADRENKRVKKGKLIDEPFGKPPGRPGHKPLSFDRGGWPGPEKVTGKALPSLIAEPFENPNRAPEPKTSDKNKIMTGLKLFRKKKFEEETINELKKKTLIDLINKSDEIPQKNPEEMKKVWQDRIWPARDRLHGKFKTKQGEKAYHCESLLEKMTQSEIDKFWDSIRKDAKKRGKKFKKSIHEGGDWLPEKEWKKRLYPKKRTPMPRTPKVNPRIGKKFKSTLKEVKENEPWREGKPRFGQRGATGTWGEPSWVSNFTSSLNPAISEPVRRTYSRISDPTYWAAEAGMAASGASSGLPFTPEVSWLYGDEPRGYREWKKEQEARKKAVAENNLQSPGVATIERVLKKAVNEILTYRNSARLRARDAYAQAEAQAQAEAEAQAQAQAEAEAQQQQKINKKRPQEQ